MRKLAWLMALLMAVCLSAALAEDARPTVYKSGDYQYTLLEDGTAKIARYTGRKNAKLTIPAALDGHRVTAIGDRAFYECESLTEVTLPDGVTGIGNYAFYECESLISMILPDGVTGIGDYAFGECESLTSVTIPNSVTSIGDYAFYECESLMSVILPDGVTSIGNYAFYECEALKSVTLPDSVTSIGKQAFEDCSFFLTLTVGRDSYAHQYAIDNGIRFTFPTPLD